MYLFRTLIVTAADAALAREIAASFGPNGENFWITAYSPTGEAPATHFITSGYVPPEFAYLVPCQFWEQDEDGIWTMTGSVPGDPVAVYQAATEQGVTCTQADVDGIFARADVTEQDVFVAADRLGIKMVQEPMNESDTI